MRLLTLTNCPLDDSLGSGYVALRYAAGLRERGHSVELLGPADYEPFPGTRRAIRYRQALGMALASVKRLARADYDVVEFYGGEAWLALSLLSRLPNRRTLLVAHSNGIEPHCQEVLEDVLGEAPGGTGREWYQLRLRALTESGFRNADAIVTVADYDREYALEESYAPAGRVLAIENPLSAAYLDLPVDFERGPVLGYCGSWLPIKGTARLESDLPRLLREFPAWRLVLVGVSDSFRAAEHFPADVLSRIEVVPRAERDTGLRALYRTFAIALLPSLYESFGLAAAEAMACGAALVSTRVGFAASLRPGEEALLLPAGAASPHLYTAVRSLIESPEMRERIARGGYLRVQSLRWNRAVEALEGAYTAWLAELRRSD